MLFEELQGVLSASSDGPLSRDVYLGLGVRQTMYGAAERATVNELFGKYRAWLAESGALLARALLAPRVSPCADARYDAVVVDEIQDLTNAELSLVLATLKEPRGFLLCGDANQIVHPNFFSWAKVKSLFYSEETEALAAPIHVLDANYRSSRTVSELANALLKIKNARFGSIDKESTSLVRPASELEGRVAGLVKKDEVLRNLDRVARTSARVAVIVLSDEQKAEARRRFSTPLVFSIHEAKGLEYEVVILFDLVSSERAAYREIADGVTQADVDGDLTFARARDKSDKSLEAYKFFVNALYVAVTRAVDTVYLVETDDGALRASTSVVVTFTEDVASFTAKASTIEDWQKEARKLELQGKDEQAEAIRRSDLDARIPVPWPVLHGAEFDDCVARRRWRHAASFNKAKQQLCTSSAPSIGLTPLTRAAEPGRPATCSARSAYEATSRQTRDRLDSRPIATTTLVRVLADVDEVRTGEAPEHDVADAADGGRRLRQPRRSSNELVERGCRIDAVDVFGRMPLQFALSRGVREPRPSPQEKLGRPLRSLVPDGHRRSECDGRLVRLSRESGRVLRALAAMMALFHPTLRPLGRRTASASPRRMLDDAALAAFPRSVLPDERRKRVYWNGGAGSRRGERVLSSRSANALAARTVWATTFRAPRRASGQSRTIRAWRRSSRSPSCSASACSTSCALASGAGAEPRRGSALRGWSRCIRELGGQDEVRRRGASGLPVWPSGGLRTP